MMLYKDFSSIKHNSVQQRHVNINDQEMSGKKIEKDNRTM